MADFKDMLKYFRERKGLSQSQLAKYIGVSSSTISMYETGRREPDFEVEERIADFFNVDLNTLRGKDPEAAGIFLSQFEISIIENYRIADPVTKDVIIRLLGLDKPSDLKEAGSYAV